MCRSCKSVHPSLFAIGDDKKKRNGRYTKLQVGYISPFWGANPFEPISMKIGMVVGVDDLIIQSKFGFNILEVSDLRGGQNFHFPIDFAGYRYNSAQPVMTRGVATGVDIGIYTPQKKSAQVNFLRGKNDIRTAIRQFYTPQNFYTPPQKKKISGYAARSSLTSANQSWLIVVVTCLSAYSR